MRRCASGNSPVRMGLKNHDMMMGTTPLYGGKDEGSAGNRRSSVCIDCQMCATLKQVCDKQRQSVVGNMSNAYFTAHRGGRPSAFLFSYSCSTAQPSCVLPSKSLGDKIYPPWSLPVMCHCRRLHVVMDSCTRFVALHCWQTHSFGTKGQSEWLPVKPTPL